MSKDHGTFHHAMDSHFFDLPLGVERDVMLPRIPVLSPETAEGSWLVKYGFLQADGSFLLTRFMVMQLVAGLLTLLIFWLLARKIRDGKPAKGRFWNFWESMVVYFRDEVVRPTIGTGHHGDHEHGSASEHGHHAAHPEQEGEEHYSDASHAVGVGGYFDDSSPAIITHIGQQSVIAAKEHPADKYLPFVLTCFFYVLFCNLLGDIPFLGAPTGNVNVTGVLAVTVFAYVIFCGSKVSGVGGFWASLAPGLDLPLPARILIGWLVLWPIEFVSLIVKHFVLAVRLFANILAGHTVLGVLLGFIAMAADAGSDAIYGTVLTASVLGQVFVTLLEVFVAFVQAFVFAFLATLFVSAAVNPH